MIRRGQIVVLALVAAFATGPADVHANVPSPETSTIPSRVLLVGLDAAGVPDPIGTLTVVVRDLANNPMPWRNVRLSFINVSDVKPSEVQADPAALSWCDYNASWVGATSGPDGSVTFRVVGRAVRSLPGSHAASLPVTAEGVLLGTVVVAALDQDGGGGMGPADAALFLEDFFSGQYWERTDFDGNGSLGPNDLSVWLQAFFASKSIQSGGVYCPWR